MILRARHPAQPDTTLGAWEAFEKTQGARRYEGYVSQPAHAALAGRIAAALEDDVFGRLPREVIDTVRLHDAGWAVPDLTALECCVEVHPHSFLNCPAEKAVEAWTRSVREAEARALVDGILTSRHFCLLAPRDDHPAHEEFIASETERREANEEMCDVSPEKLDRYTAALGFCDLLSLCLCSGLNGAIQMPLCHPASPDAEDADQISITIFANTIGFDRPVLHRGTQVYLDMWVGSAPGPLKHQRICWRSI
ncbi:MAG: hypothetical protein JWM54_31 [Acidobacteriaceae bacterium]|nr:hypothetical protein [Acidobacteriaceae bacterium]